MRFLLGLAMGAAVVLAAAEGLAGADWQVRLSALGDYLQHRIGQRAAAGPGSADPPRTAAESSTDREPAREPILRPPDPRQVESQHVESQRVESEPVEEPLPGPPPLEEVADADPPMVPAEASSQAVWVPFHSQMSATGFAERLTETLDHPFRVERRGPGRYQVVFAYADEPERQALLAQAVEATGLPL